MAMRPGPRQPVGSAAWVAEERSSALQIACSEVEEFGFSARNEIDWLNEHMAEIFSENQINVAEIFKTPGKLRGRTPRTARKANPLETRAPLSDIFSATPKGAPNAFAISNLKQAPTPKLKIAEDRTASPAKTVAFQKPQQREPVPATDSGYHGSQTQEDVMDIDDPTEVMEFPLPPSPAKPPQTSTQTPAAEVRQAARPTPTQTQQSFEDTFQSAKEEQTKTAKVISPQTTTRAGGSKHAAIRSPSPVRDRSSPLKTSPVKSSPQKSSPAKHAPVSAKQASDLPDATMTMAVDKDEDHDDEIRSPSDGSSPIRPIVRKSSLNFASLPAREPLTSNKSLGARMSRTSHLEQTRTSYYNRPTGGKSLGHVRQPSEGDDHDDDDDDEMDVDDDVTVQTEEKRATAIAAHNKTYTQRLQDQISMLGKSQSNGPRPSKSIPNLAVSQKDPFASNPPAPEQRELPAEEQPLSSPKKDQAVTPGAFPDDDEDDWIAPPTTTQNAPANTESRPVMSKSYSTDVMEGLHGKDTVSGSDFVLPKQRQPDSRPQSPRRAPAIPERTTSAPGHTKSASVPVFPHFNNESDDDSASLRKAISVSNPTLATVAESSQPGTPKSPSRNFRDGPLKQVKNKLSSILKSSNRLLASSAAISAEGKFSLLSPSTTKLGVHPGPSVESLQLGKEAESLYPDLTQHAPADTQGAAGPSSPSRPNRKTRASAERERREQKQKDKETKEAQRLADQMDKLEKAREKEREKARVFSKEQERVAAMEKQMAAQKEQEKATPSSPAKEAPKPTRTSPRKAKAQMEAEAKAAAAASESADNDVDMVEVPSTMPPPSVPRSATGAQGAKGRELKRPMKPTKEPLNKPKQAPTLIRVNTSSQHSGFHPSNSVLAATLQDTLGGQQHQLKSKASQQSLHAKPSLQSLKSSVSSSGRPKALEMAAKRKMEEEREAQRKREAKAEIERKRAAMQEEERRQEQQRRQEVERQKQKEREQAALDAEAKKNAQRQAAIEKAKQTRAPPPAVRSQPNGPPEYTSSQQSTSRPPSRLQSTMHRPQEEASRPVNAVLSNTATKAQPKRPFPQDGNDDGSSRPAVPRSGPSYQKEVKRMRMTDEFDEDDEMEIQASHSIIKGPPVRPSGGLKKDMPSKSGYQNSYANPPPSATRDLFKATVTAQHNSQVKAAHPLDMAQVSKSAIPFAPNPSAATHKTPARPANAALGKSAAKSAAKSSPRFQNGDAIELPEIQTDDEDDEDDGHIGVAPWADSPELRRALSRQETMDPLQIFGPPAPLNMEEVFNKSKDRWHKFRARTSSANWSGSDRLTEEDIRKDLAARDKMRREGGWSYELSREMI